MQKSVPQTKCTFSAAWLMVEKFKDFLFSGICLDQLCDIIFSYDAFAWDNCTDRLFMARILELLLYCKNNLNSNFKNGFKKLALVQQLCTLLTVRKMRPKQMNWRNVQNAKLWLWCIVITKCYFIKVISLISFKQFLPVCCQSTSKRCAQALQRSWHGLELCQGDDFTHYGRN